MKTDKLIYILLIIQPIIDLITSLMTTYSPAILSIGALSRTVIMGCLFLYISRYLILNKQSILWMFICSYVSILLMVLINFILKDPYIISGELNFVLKTSYYVVMIFTGIILIDKQSFSKEIVYRATTVISIIIGISYWIAIFSQTSIESYTYSERGYSGWFYSANELSVIVVILLGLMINQLSHHRSPSTWIAFIFILSMLPMIGTKTAFYGGLLIIAIYLMRLLITYNVQLFKDKGNVLFFAIIITFICFTPFSPIFSNTEQMDLRISQINTDVVEHAEVQETTIISRLLSSRNIYLQNIKEDYLSAEVMRKVFGLGYAGNYSTDPKLIEMDFFDLFFSYGVIGSLLLLIPLLYICKLLFFPIQIAKTTLLFTLCLCFGIAFLAGHVLFAPSVMTYLTILLLAIGLQKDGKDVSIKYGT